MFLISFCLRLWFLNLSYSNDKRNLGEKYIKFVRFDFESSLLLALTDFRCMVSWVYRGLDFSLLERKGEVLYVFIYCCMFLSTIECLTHG